MLKYARPHYDNYRARFCVGHNPADGNLHFVLYTKNSWNKRVGNRRDKRGTHLVFFKLVNGFYSIMINRKSRIQPHLDDQSVVPYSNIFIVWRWWDKQCASWALIMVIFNVRSLWYFNLRRKRELESC
jgi:hypothetical protein